MTVAVVVPTYGRGPLLARCLASLAALDPAPDLTIVVDGNESPVCLAPQRPFATEHLREPNRGAAHARNTGYRAAMAAGADLVCFIDDDAVAPCDWLGRHVALHRQMPEAGAVGGGVTNLYEGSVVADYTHRVIFRPLRDDAGPVRFLLTLNASFKPACLDQVGLFAEDMPAAGGEDVELGWRISLSGWISHYQPDLVVGHHYATSWRSLVRQQRAYGRGFVSARWQWRDIPGGEFLDKPWYRVIAGTAPHLARQAHDAMAEGGTRMLLPSVVRELAFRRAAAGERWRLEQAARSGR
jgi:GT2 family glycosyltransferase